MAGFTAMSHLARARKVFDIEIAALKAVRQHLDKSFDRAVDYRHAAWRGRIRASAGVAASLGAAAVATFDAAHEALLAHDFPDQPLRVPHRCWAAIGAKPERSWTTRQGHRARARRRFQGAKWWRTATA